MWDLRICHNGNVIMKDGFRHVRFCHKDKGHPDEHEARFYGEWQSWPNAPLPDQPAVPAGSN